MEGKPTFMTTQASSIIILLCVLQDLVYIFSELYVRDICCSGQLLTDFPDPHLVLWPDKVVIIRDTLLASFDHRCLQRHST